MYILHEINNIAVVKKFKGEFYETKVYISVNKYISCSIFVNIFVVSNKIFKRCRLFMLIFREGFVV